jgi:hypothetical protein
LAAHVTGYHLLVGTLLLLPVLRDGWPASNALLTLIVSAATHAVIDRRWPVRALLRLTASPNFATIEWGFPPSGCPEGSAPTRLRAAVGG